MDSSDEYTCLYVVRKSQLCTVPLIEGCYKQNKKKKKKRAVDTPREHCIKVAPDPEDDRSLFLAATGFRELKLFHIKVFQSVK